jgi:hypothetical protein
MSEPQGPARVATLARKHVEILIVESNSGDIYLTEMAFKEAGLTSGLRVVTDGEYALMYVRREGSIRMWPCPISSFSTSRCQRLMV